jgi:CrcB protein
MSGSALLWVALGGAAGSVLRAVVGHALQGKFPWATLLINVVGSFVIGWVMVRVGALEPAPAARLQALAAVGFCGGFTTFSTFSYQTLQQLLQGQWGAAVANILLSVALCLAATWLGLRLGQA